jgi:hypothetical protein
VGRRQRPGQGYRTRIRGGGRRMMKTRGGRG